MSTASVSLIVPCFNHAATLGRAVVSALTQSALHEIVIVDDCSTDTSLDIGYALCATDARVRVVRADCNGGPGAARNLGAKVAHGSHLSFLDADDEFICDFFQEALDVLVTQPSFGAVKPEEEFFDPVKGYILPEPDPRHAAAVLSSVHGLVIEKQRLLRLGGFPEGMAFRGPFGGEDVAFMQALMQHCQPIGRIDRACYRVWSQAGSHVDRFLASTRLQGGSYEFVHLDEQQLPGGALDRALQAHLADAAVRFGNSLARE